MTKSDGSLNPIPPYQAVDIMLSGDRIKELTPPVAGYMVTFPDNGLSAVMLTHEEATPEKLADLKSMSKWPDHIFYRKAWLHSEEVVFSKISKRKHWSPR